MRVKALLCLALLSATGAAAASSGFLLGADYSEWLPPYIAQIATDISGALYILSTCTQTTTYSPYPCVTKLSPDGKTILWQHNLGFTVESLEGSRSPMAVDPNGGVYLIPTSNYGDASILVAKLNADGTGLAWQAPIGGFLTPGPPAVLAVDSQGRAYMAGTHGLNSQVSGVVRLNAAGTAVEYTARIPGIVSSIAVDGSGAALVAGSGFLARLAPDGSPGYYSTTPSSTSVSVAVDGAGNAVVYAGNGTNQAAILRFDSTGAQTLSQTIPGAYANYFPGFAVDAAGNAYISGFSSNMNLVRNSIATCGSALTGLLGVFAPDGALLQATYIPGAAGGAPFIATGPNSTVFVLAVADTAFSPSRTGPFPSGFSSASFLFLWHLSYSPNARTLPLSCVTNAASLGTGPIAPGELVALFGNGLGPPQGVPPQATPESPYPTEAAGVTVTFDGTPAPLLWVQNSQINAVAPWSLTPGRDTEICVSSGNVPASCVAWPVTQLAPAVFTVDGVHAVAMNQDRTINSESNPAPVGSIVAVWANGLGPITPGQADGTLVGLPLPANEILPVQVQSLIPPFEPCHPGAGPVPCPTTPSYVNFQVTYAGPAPFMVAGVSQINFRIAADAPSWSPNNPFTLNLLSSVQSPGFQIYVAGHP
jgi:uncharacterized protein (TIGR03437 family)